jgi:hypothetical protein
MNTPMSNISRVKRLATIAVLLFAAALYCWHWNYGRGAFWAKPVGIPIRIGGESSIKIPFSVSERGHHDVELQYLNEASDDLERDLYGLTGRATLLSGGTVLLETDLPVYHRRYDGHSIALVLFSFETEPAKQYTLLLKINRIPPGLERAQATVKIEIDPHYYVLFGIVLLVSLLMTIAGVLYAIRLIRFVLRIEKKKVTRFN